MTVAAVLSRDVTEWDEFTGRLEAVNTVVRPPARLRLRLRGALYRRGAGAARRRCCFEIDPRPFQAEVDRLRAELARAKATVRRATRSCDRAGRLATENAMSHEEHERRASFAEESAAQVASVEAALRAAELNLEFTRVTAPIDGRVGRAIVTAGQPGLERPGRGDAADHGRLARSDLRLVRRRRADLPAVRGRRAPARRGDAHRDAALPISHGAGRRTMTSPLEGRLDFLDNQLDPATGTIRGRAIFTQPRRQADARAVRPPAAAADRRPTRRC